MSIGIHFEQLVDGSWRAHAPEIDVSGFGFTREESRADLHRNREPAIVTIDVGADVGTDHAALVIAGTF